MSNGTASHRIGVLVLTGLLAARALAGDETGSAATAPPSRASCAVFLDFDNDSDLDLALVDEEADVVLLMRNGR